MRTYTEVCDASTGFDDVIRIEENGAFVDDIIIFEADRDLVKMFLISGRHLRAAQRVHEDARDNHQVASRILTQNVWGKRGGAR